MNEPEIDEESTDYRLRLLEAKINKILNLQFKIYYALKNKPERASGVAERQEV
jgi:hypothetical protein